MSLLFCHETFNPRTQSSQSEFTGGRAAISWNGFVFSITSVKCHAHKAKKETVCI